MGAAVSCCLNTPRLGGVKFWFWLTGKLGCAWVGAWVGAWVVHGIWWWASWVVNELYSGYSDRLIYLTLLRLVPSFIHVTNFPYEKVIK